MIKNNVRKSFEPRYKGDYRVVQVRGQQVEVRPATGGETQWEHISHVKYILPADNVIRQMPDYSQFGRKTTLRLNPDNIPDLNWKLATSLNTVPAHQLMLAIAIGDIHLNKLSYDQASQKYQISKSQIQRAISGKADHKKGGKQYHLERKRKVSDGTSSVMKVKKTKMEREQEEEEEIPQMALFPEQAQQDILPDLVNDDDDQFPEVNIDA